jgi:D-alanyl-D-alanine carboxypeptidase (penicillin-binding protein 5/6)
MKVIIHSLILSLLLAFITAESLSAGTIKILSRQPYAAAFVVEANTDRVFFSENVDKQLYPASMVKMMGLLIILEKVEKGELSLDDKVTITPETERITGSGAALRTGEIFTLEQLLYAMSVKSANDAAMAIAIHASGSADTFVELMNERAAELGMEDTTFRSVHGLPPTKKGQYPDVSTARDMAILSRAVIENSRALEFTSARGYRLREGEEPLKSHNYLLWDVPGCDGLKTGFFYAAGFSIAATAQRGTNRVIAVVMDCKYRKDRDRMATRFIENAFEKLQVFLPTVPEPVIIHEEVKNAPVVVVSEPVKAVAQVDEADEEESGGWGSLVIGIVCLAGAVCVAIPFLRRRGRHQHGRITFNFMD